VFLWVLPLAPTVSMIKGSTFHPLAIMSLIRPVYLSVFLEFYLASIYHCSM
jgi:hypothetical protein